ncbi:THAP domain-containing protein 2-like [Scylla paramamosain]|uniref:THAP domain-containing protein 2-like n=1 Tax=Scylla paramamosain TaxID=85552 RepID=UPI0030832295
MAYPTVRTLALTLGNLDLDLKNRESNLQKMPRSCCVPRCKSIYYSTDASGFRCPKDEKRREQWSKSVHRKDFVPIDNTIICSKHSQPLFITPEESISRTDDISILGEFNVQHQLWLSSPFNDHPGELAFNFAILHDLEQLVQHPIRFSNRLEDTPNILDLLLTSL